MQKQQGKNNALSLFGVPPIPSDNPIRNLLDPVPPDRGSAGIRTESGGFHAELLFQQKKVLGVARWQGEH
jgi:hypothetical protein